MITKLTQEEKTIVNTMVANLAAKWAKKLKVSTERLHKILSEATVELYQEKPFTTVIVKKTVNGKQVRAAGFSKYNLNDERPKSKMQWNESRGKYITMSRAYNAFITEMVQLGVYAEPMVTVTAIVESTQAEMVETVAVTA